MAKSSLKITIIFPAVALLAAFGCGGPLPPPDPYNLAGAKEGLSQGNQWYARGCYIEAENHFAQGLDFARMSDDVLLIIRAQNSLGAAALARGEVDLAASRLESALATSQNHPSEPELDKILGNLGTLAFKLGRFDDAGNFWTKAVEIAQEHNSNPSPYLCDLARLQLEMGNQSEFLDLSAQAFKDIEHETDPYVKADALNLAGQAAVMQNQPAEAENYYRQALELDRQTENTKGLAQNTESLGLLMINLERYHEAAGFLDRSFFLWLAAGEDKKADRVFSALQNLSKAQKYPKKLYTYQEARRRPEPHRLTSHCP